MHLDRIKLIPITEYGAVAYGLTPYKARARYWSFKEMDSLMISPESNTFWRNSTGDSGSIIDFVCCMENITAKEAINKLNQFLGDTTTDLTLLPLRAKVEKQPFVAPKKSNRRNATTNYLNSVRSISPSVIDWLFSKNAIYQEEGKRNIIFASYLNGKMIYAQRCLTGNNIESHKRSFEIEGSDCTYCWRVENNSNTLIVGEAVIDLMSFMTMLELQNKEFKNFDYLSTNGTNKIASVFRAVEENHYLRIVLCFDNDDAGNKAKNSVIEKLKELNFSGHIFDKSTPYKNEDLNDLLKRKLLNQ